MSDPVSGPGPAAEEDWAPGRWHAVVTGLPDPAADAFTWTATTGAGLEA